MASFEDTLEALREYDVDEGVLQDLEDAWKASPIRKERDAAKKEAEELRSKLQKAQARNFERKLKEKGVKISPSYLKVPDDLDLDDDDRVETFLVEAGLVEPPKDDIPEEEQQAHEAMSDIATNGGKPNSGTITAADVQSWPKEKIVAFGQKYPQEMKALKLNPSGWKATGLEI